MKTRQQYIRAAFTTEQQNVKNLNGSKELIGRTVIVDKKTERVVVDCRTYLGGSTVHCALWVNVSEAKKPDSWAYAGTTGLGQAGGYGYHKESAAVAAAISSAGIVLHGSPYNRAGEGFKKQAHIGGCGDSSICSALLAIAYAAGYRDCIVVD